jgi:4-amino-4-deoxy-L-arabinose transferase-like glycosyltransferase
VTVVISAGIVLRLGLIWLTTSPTEPLNGLYPGFSDGEDYIEIARSLITTGVFGYAGRPTAFRPPAYPLSVAFLYKLFGDTLTPIRLFQVLLFVPMAISYSHVTRRYFGAVAGLLTALIFSVYPLFLFLSTEIATESLYMTLGSVVFALTFALIDKKESGNKPILAFSIGVCCGLGILTRANMMFVFILVQIIIIWKALEGRYWNWIVLSIALWIGNGVVAFPWLLRNYSQFGSSVLATNLDYNLFRGTFDLAGGPPFGPPFVAVFRKYGVMYEDEIENPRNNVLPFSEIKNEQNARAAAIAIIRSDPASWLKERFRNIAYLWLNLQWDSSLFAKRSTVVLSAITVSLIYYALLASALGGTIVVWKNGMNYGRQQFVVITWSFILAAMPVVITFVGKRYRISMIDPYLTLLASVGIASWLTSLKRIRL